MDSSPIPSVQHAQDYHDTAHRWGYRYRQLELRAARLTARGAAKPIVSTGWLDTEEPQPGLVVTRSDVTFTCDAEAEAEMVPGLLIGLSLAGPAEASIEDAGVISVQAREAIAIRFDRATGFSSRLQQSGERRCTLSIFAHADWLETHGLGHVLGPTGLAEAAMGSAVARWLPSVHLQGLIGQTMSPGRAGPLSRLLTEALALELLVAGVRHLERPPVIRSDLRPADHARMQRVRDQLLAAPAADHSLATLAREAGVSVSVLTDHFSRAFGQPVFGFLRDLRLERAYRGLRDEGWSVAQAAYQAGFQHPTNFAAAFRRRFGFPPSKLRP